MLCNVTAVAVAPARDADVADRARRIRAVDDRVRHVGRTIETIRLDVDHVACASHPRAQRLQKRHVNARDARAAGVLRGLDLHRRERMPRISLEVVGEPGGDDVAQLDDELLRVGLGGDVRHGIGCLDRDHPEHGRPRGTQSS